jgi:ABC-2 type transport system permease protein
MISITSILKEAQTMNKLKNYLFAGAKNETKAPRPLMAIVNKEITDHVRSWRFIILLAIISLTCMGSLYTALTNFGQAIKPDDPEGTFFFLKLFTISDGSLPSFFVFISFLGPLLGISLGFDAINSEHNNGTLSHLLAQPVYRDNILNAKFLSSLFVISVLFFALGFLVMGLGLVILGVPPSFEEVMRIIFFIMLSIVYVAFWLNLSILFSVIFRQPATSALSGISVWLFFLVFYGMIINVITKGMSPPQYAPEQAIAAFEHFRITLLRFMPNQLFSDATTTLLMPSVRSLGPLTMEQVIGTVPGPLPIGQSLLLVWPQVTGLISATILCFWLSYYSFMRREIRSR